VYTMVGVLRVLNLVHAMRHVRFSTPACVHTAVLNLVLTRLTGLVLNLVVSKLPRSYPSTTAVYSSTHAKYMC
jgi:hypothetical protein